MGTPEAWTAKHYIQLVAAGTACLCMLLVIAGILLAMIRGTISPTILGDYKSGAGLIGVLYIMYRVILKALT